MVNPTNHGGTKNTLNSLGDELSPPESATFQRGSRRGRARRARAASLSLIPTNTGAAKAIGLVIPSLKGKLDGTAIRVPTSNVSLIDFVFNSKVDTSEKEINQICIDASNKELKNILNIINEPLVSVDFNHSPYSSNFDTSQTKVINGRLCRVLSWYDNEWGFATRLVDLAKYII